jgi:hypothetical protein
VRHVRCRFEIGPMMLSHAGATTASCLADAHQAEAARQAASIKGARRI